MRPVFVALGFLFLGLGAVGTMIPVLPTTPFLLLASVCFLKSSPRFYQWFLSTRIYKNHLQDFAENRSMTLRTKLSILLPVTVILAVVFYLLNSTVGRVIIAGTVVLKYYYFFFRIKTISKPAAQQQEPKLP